MNRPPVAIYSLLTLLLGMLLQGQALAVTVCKDGTCDHTSIKSALLDTNHKGENVIITKPGLYEESGLTIGGTSQGGPRILMSQSNDPEGTIIDASGSDSAVVSCLILSTIRGITLRGGIGGVRLCAGGGSTLDNVIIENNIANGEGGGLQASWGPMTVINSTFRDNRATSGGAISMNAQSTLTIKDSTFENNKAVGDGSRARGGAIAVSGLVSMLIENTDILGNQVTSPLRSSGGGIKAGSTTILNDVNLLNNSVFATSGISEGGGIYKTKETSSGPVLEINGGSISGNEANTGGGIWVGINANLNLFGGSVTGNNARNGVAGSSGGGIFCASSDGKSIAAGHISVNTPDQVVGCGVPETGTTRTTADNEDSGTEKDPVNTYTGELFQQYDPDINLGGPMPLYFARYYASGFEQVGIFAHMGDNWRHNFDWSLLLIGSNINIVNHRGRTIQFTWNGAKWNLAGKTDVVYQLSENAGIYTLLDPRSQRFYVFNIPGNLTSISDGKGNIHSLIYNTGRLSQVADGLGRVLNLSYADSSHLTSVNDGLGRSVIYSGR